MLVESEATLIALPIRKRRRPVFEIVVDRWLTPFVQQPDLDWIRR